MPAPDYIYTTGVILEQKGSRLYRASLPNGKEVLAHLSKRDQQITADFSPGARVKLELTTFDFSTARIAGAAEYGES